MMDKLIYIPEKLPQIICEDHPEWIGMYDTAWKMAFENIEYMKGKDWLPQMTCMPGVGIMWQWDSCFMSFIARYSNGLIPAMNNIDNLYRQQRDDGYISMAYFIGTDKKVYGERINPPIYAWAEWEYFLVTGDDTRFLKVLPILTRYYKWIKSNRRRVCGLYWFEDSGSSGMDNSPRSGYEAAKIDGSDVCYIDLACQQAMSAHYLSKIAGYTGNSEIQSYFNNEYDDLYILINHHHWCEKYGFYFDLFGRSNKELLNKFINHKTIAAFWPILSGIADERKVDRMIEHLVNPYEFMTAHPVPSLSKDDPNYNPLGGYWLGTVWASTNYMIVRGLRLRNRFYLAREISLKHLNAMVEVTRNENYDSIWEGYSPEYMRPATCENGGLVRSNFVGWTGLGPITMLIENIFGFEFDTLNNQINWIISMKGVHGIKNLMFNKRTVSLVCEKWSHIPGETRIIVETTGEINLKINFMGKVEYDTLGMIECKGKRFVLEPGRHEIYV